MEFEWTDVKDGLPFALAWFRDEHATGTSDDMLVEALSNGEVSFEFEDEETGETILHYIVKYDQAGYLDETENWEDCVNVPNKRGETPLYYAIEGEM